MSFSPASLSNQIETGSTDSITEAIPPHSLLKGFLTQGWRRLQGFGCSDEEALDIFGEEAQESVHPFNFD